MALSAPARLDQIVALAEARGVVSVADLSQDLGVSSMTIRRDLAQLDAAGRLQRIYGGASRLPPTPELPPPPAGAALSPVEAVDVLIATAVNPQYDRLLLDRVTKRRIPVIAESLVMPNQATLVAVDNFQAAHDLGRWAGSHLRQTAGGQAHLLDLTFTLANTQTRSRGFLAGLQETCPKVDLVLSLNAQSRHAIAYQLAYDALSVHREINLIFAINDTTASGALQACRDLDLDPRQMTVVTFGLEGDTLKDELVAGGFCQAGLAMFPEVVGEACIQAAVAAYNHVPLPRQIVTPHVVLTPAALPDYYRRTSRGWEIIPGTVPPAAAPALPAHPRLPESIGMIVPFSEHEWYQRLSDVMCTAAARLGVRGVAIDAEDSVRDEIEARRRSIAQRAAELVQPEDVLLVDGGPTAAYLAEALKARLAQGLHGVTVITNSVTVFDLLNRAPGLILISTGGALRYSSQLLVGPTAENALADLRADKLFLSVSGLTPAFGLSHMNISEVTVKSAMIHSARQVILLADHTVFGQESVIQLAPLTVIHQLITDDAAPAGLRLEFSKLGIQVILAPTL